MENVDHWNHFLAYLVDNRERIDVNGHSYNSVERDLAAEKILHARIALIASVVKINKFVIEDCHGLKGVFSKFWKL